MALTDIPANTTISFTNTPWQSATGPSGDWATGNAAPVTVNFSSSSDTPPGTPVTVGIALQSTGDFCLAYTGTPSSPTFIAAIGGVSKTTGEFSAQGTTWIPNGGTIPTALPYNTTLPAGLSGAAMFVPSGSGDKILYSCSSPLTGTASALLADLITYSNWAVGTAGTPCAFSVTP